MQKDVSSVSAEQSPQGKRQHVIEVCNFVDAGTSLALFAQARDDFHESFGAGSGDYLLAPGWASTSDDEFFAIRAGWAGCQAGISPLRCVGSCCV